LTAGSAPGMSGAPDRSDYTRRRFTITLFLAKNRNHTATGLLFDGFAYYERGIYRYTWSSERGLLHAVRILGYDDRTLPIVSGE
jgi:hypothetical protein